MNNWGEPDQALNQGKRRLATAWIQMNPDCDLDKKISWVKSISIFFTELIEG